MELGYFPRVSCQLLLTIESDNEVKSGLVNRYPGIYIKIEENPGEPQLGDPLMKVLRKITNGYLGVDENPIKPQEGDLLSSVRPVIASNGTPFCQNRYWSSGLWSRKS